jgi:hypothetical protein
MNSMYKLAKGPALTPFQTRAPGSTGTNARVGAPQSTRQTQGFGEKPPKPNTILPNCRHPAFRGPVAALPLRRRSLAWLDRPTQTVQLSSGKATLPLD